MNRGAVAVMSNATALRDLSDSLGNIDFEGMGLTEWVVSRYAWEEKESAAVYGHEDQVAGCVRIHQTLDIVTLEVDFRPNLNHREITSINAALETAKFAIVDGNRWVHALQKPNHSDPARFWCKWILTTDFFVEGMVLTLL